MTTGAAGGRQGQWSRRVAVGGATVAAVAIASGLASAFFLWALDAASGAFDEHRGLLALLPLAGLAFGVATHRWGGRSNAGMQVVMSQWRHPTLDGVPAALTGWVLGGTLLTHVFGGSAGREGTAVQMAAGVADPLARRLGWDAHARRVLLSAAVAAGFASVFGVPWAGAVFAFEVRPRGVSGRRWWRDPDERSTRLAAVPVVVGAAWLAHLTVLATGVTHTARSPLRWPTVGEVGWVVAAGALVGGVAFSFVHAVDLVRWAMRRVVVVEWVRPAAGGAVLVALVVVSGRADVAGLSLPLLDRALGGVEVATWSFALKAVFTAVTVGSGFRGGEVTPLFVIGATLGVALAGWWGASASLLAAVGMAAAFGAAANAPLAATVLGGEVFGWRAVPVMLLGCGVARLCSGPHHLYVDGDASP